MGKFVIRQAKTGPKFDLVADSGQVVASSQLYRNIKTCMSGIYSVKSNAAKAALEDQTVEGYKTQVHPKYELYTDNAGAFRFRLKAKNGQVIASSKAYEDIVSCLSAIEAVREGAAGAPVEDLTAPETEQTDTAG